MRYDSILFDLDGTLWDSTLETYLCWTEILRQQPDLKKIPTQKELEGVMGLAHEDLMRTLYPELSRERALEIFDLCCKAENVYLREHKAKSFPGMKETLRKLSRTRFLAIVSNCGEGYIESYLDSMGTGEFFRDYESYGRTGKQKAENIRLVIGRNGLQHPVFVGDTVWDLEAAQAAGIPFIHAAYGFGRPEGDFPRITEPAGLIELV